VPPDEVNTHDVTCQRALACRPPAEVKSLAPNECTPPRSLSGADHPPANKPQTRDGREAIGNKDAAALPTRLFGVIPCHVSANVAFASGLRSVAIRTIQIAALATYARYAGWSRWRVSRPSQMSVDWPPEQRPLSGERELWKLHPALKPTRDRPLWDQRGGRLPGQPQHIKVYSCFRATRLLLFN
jgi:hypothetical protein